MVKTNRLITFVACFAALAAVARPAMAQDFIQPRQETVQEKKILVCMRYAAVKMGAKVETIGVKDFSGIRSPSSAPVQGDRAPFIRISDNDVYAEAYLSPSDRDGIEALAGTRLNENGSIDFPYRRINSGVDGGKYRVFAEFDQNGGQARLKSSLGAQLTVRDFAERLAGCVLGS